VKAADSTSGSRSNKQEPEFPARALMRVPEPADRAFVERVTRELAQARERCLQVLLPQIEP